MCAFIYLGTVSLQMSASTVLNCALYKKDAKNQLQEHFLRITFLQSAIKNTVEIGRTLQLLLLLEIYII
jgi:hypothetical protein